MRSQKVGQEVKNPKRVTESRMMKRANEKSRARDCPKIGEPDLED